MESSCSKVAGLQPATFITKGTLGVRVFILTILQYTLTISFFHGSIKFNGDNNGWSSECEKQILNLLFNNYC